MKKIIVIGAGASGVVAAVEAKCDNNKVIVLEKNSEALKKLMITGSGRCNYFNEDFALDKYNVRNTLLSKVINYEEEFKSFFARIGIVPNIINGYYYPYSGSALSIKNALLNEARSKNVEFSYNYSVTKIEKINDKYLINDELYADKIIISAGSKAYPITGSTGEMYDILSSLKVKINPVMPALVQLKSDSKICKKWPSLRVKAKLSLYVEDEFVTFSKGELQLTDYGISGICTFDISALAVNALRLNKKVNVSINFMPIDEITDFKKFYLSRVKTLNDRNVLETLGAIINEKLLIELLNFYKIDPYLMNYDLSDEQIEKIKKALTDFKVNIIGSNDFSSSQVCQGGVDLDSVNEFFGLKQMDGAFITGELLDVHGLCGGYNLAFAFISGMIAGRKAKIDD